METERFRQTPNPEAFIGERLRLARHFWTFTIEQLGERVGASPQFISKLEKGERSPGSELLDALCEILGFRSEFFYSRSSLHGERACNFRKRGTTSQILQKQAVARSQLFALFVDYLDSQLDLPKVNIPKIDPHEDTEQIAQLARAHWGLGSDRPIKSMSRVLENAGAVIVKYDGETRSKVDAFSVVRSRPVVIMNREKDCPSRWIWDSAHEGGHLVMHQELDCSESDREDQANGFAAAFLLPRAAFSREYPHGRVDWGSIFELKQRWRVSAAAIVRRAHSLGLIETAQYRRAYKHINFKKWNKGEPYEPAEEKPEIVTGALEIMARKRQGPAEIAQALGWGHRVFETVVDVRIPPMPTTNVNMIEDFRRRKTEGIN